MTTWYTKNFQALQYFIYFHYNEMGNEKKWSYQGDIWIAIIYVTSISKN